MDGTGFFVAQPEILFTHAYMMGEDRQNRGKMHPLPPLLPAEVAAWIEDRADTVVSFWDSTFRMDEGAFEVAISRERPRVAWIYCHPTTRAMGLRFCSIARRSGAVVLAGGPDAQLYPARYLRSGADAILHGSGEAATLDLLVGLRTSDYRPTWDLLGRVAGISYLDEHGTVREAAGAVREQPIDALPLPFRDPEATRIHLERWLKVRKYRPLALRSARGCPLACGFCTHSVFGKPYQRRRPEAVVAEMKGLAGRFPLDRFVFMDELFVFDDQWLRDFANGLKGATVPFEATAHPNTVTPSAIAALVDARCTRLELDATSGSGRLLDALGWTHDPSSVFRAASLIREAGIELGLRVQIGLPGETREDLDQTLEMVDLIGPAGVEVTRVDPGAPAIFRKDWCRVVAGPVVEDAARSTPLPGPVLVAAANWLTTRGQARLPEGPAARLRRAASQPLLRAAVKALPGLRRR